jgi:inorganic pyrophosphatase
MSESSPPPFFRWRPHPWHGLEAGPEPPERVYAYLEITPFDTIKYEVDKRTGYLKVDRPQPYSSLAPMLYGFIPRSYCDVRVAALCPGAARGDRDPLDICVLSERPVHRPELLVSARVVGGLQTLDGGEADDKIVAVLAGDFVWGEAQDIADIPLGLVRRLEHYFVTYKQIPGAGERSRVEVLQAYGREHALRVVAASLADYADAFDAAIGERSGAGGGGPGDP